MQVESFVEVVIIFREDIGLGSEVELWEPELGLHSGQVPAVPIFTSKFSGIYKVVNFLTLVQSLVNVGL